MKFRKKRSAQISLRLVIGEKRVAHRQPLASGENRHPVRRFSVITYRNQLDAPRPWVINVRHPEQPAFSLFTIPVSTFETALITLDVTVSTEEAQRLYDLTADLAAMRQRGVRDRSLPTFSWNFRDRVTISDLEISEEEANRIANGEDPVEVLLGPEKRVRLAAVLWKPEEE